MKNSSWIIKSGFALMILGAMCIAFILLSLMITGSWSGSPEIVQIWGSILRPIGEIPIIGNFIFILWGVFFIPGYFIIILGKKIENRPIYRNNSHQVISDIPSEKLKKKTINYEKHVKNKHLRDQQIFKVFVDDNFHYMDTRERYQEGEYETENEAINVCKKIVDDYLQSAYKPGMTSKQLYKSYVSHGEDPFIEGGSFRAWSYAEKRSAEFVEEKNKLSKKKRSIDSALDHWKFELDYKYGLLLPESEILEDENYLYFYQTDRNKMCAAWDKKDEIWKVNIDRTSLEGLSFSTPKQFEKIVFKKDTCNEGYSRKQYFIEYLLLGLDVDAIKTLSKNINNGAKVEFSVDAKTWNEMVIGNFVELENGTCKFFEKNSNEYRGVNFSMQSSNWEINIEFIFGDDEENEQHIFSIKDFGGYYH